MAKAPSGQGHVPFDKAKLNDKQPRQIFENMDIVIIRVKSTFQGARLVYLSILKRNRWCPETRQLAMDINWCMKEKHGAKVV